MGERTMLSKAAIEQQISEMWTALADIPEEFRDEAYDQAVREAHKTEVDLWERYRKQEAIRTAAFNLLDAAEAAQLALEKIPPLTGRVIEAEMNSAMTKLKNAIAEARRLQ